MGVSLAGVVRWVAGGGSVLSVCGLVCVTGAYVVVVVVCGSLTLCLCVSVSLCQYLCLDASRVSLAACLSLSIFSTCLIGIVFLLSALFGHSPRIDHT